MKAGTLYQRDGLAQRRILEAAATLAERFGVAAQVLENLQMQRGDALVRAMQQREAIADLLESLVERAVLKSEGKTPEFSLEAVLERINEAGVSKTTLQKIREALGGGSE